MKQNLKYTALMESSDINMIISQIFIKTYHTLDTFEKIFLFPESLKLYNVYVK